MKKVSSFIIIAAFALVFASCNSGANKSKSSELSGSAAEKAYVKPGEHDEFYAFISGGFNGQLSV